MQFQVPNFLETEQHIIGPFTFAKFVVMVGVAGVVWILYYLMGFIGWLILTVIIVTITLIFLFGSYNGRAMHLTFVDAVRHFISARRYTWFGAEEKESVSEFVLTKKEVRSAPQAQKAPDKREENPDKNIEKISKMLDKV